ncbi:MAG: biotin-dependent carboxyltransferase family protein [Anaerolineae bacterium]
MSSPALEVIISGFLTTIQDMGRPHAMRHGVPASGAMDAFALQAANRLVGNPPDAAAVEITAGGTIFVALAPLVVAITGADLAPRLDDQPAPLWASFVMRPAARLAFATRRRDWGARAYLAVAGGVDVPRVLGSRSTDLAGGFGGLEGRALQAGDVLCVSTAAHSRAVGQVWREDMRPAYGSRPALRVLPGPHADRFTPESIAALYGVPWRVGQQSNRIGYRLEGPKLVQTHSASLPSLGVVMGALQVPPDGWPILLMADTQTTGGYPIAGVVIRADLPLAAQLLPGDSLRLLPVSEDEAVAAWQRYQHWLAHGLIQPDADDAELALGWAGALS